MAATTVVGPDSGLTQAQLAARYGLGVAGARPSLTGYVKQLWLYRHFTATYATSKVLVTFSTARLGRLWQVLTPLTNAAVYYLIFGVILNTRGNVDNFIAYLCTGLFIFNFTQAVILAGVQSISSNLSLIRALHFPRGCLPIAETFTQLQHMVASIIVLMGIVLLTGEPLTAKWILIVPALILQSVFNAGLALSMARFGSKATDLKQVMPFVMRTWMYASGVLYSVENFDKHLSPHILVKVVEANPLLVYIELARYALLTSSPLASPPLKLWLLGIGWALLIGIGGFVHFWRGEREYGRG